MYYELAIAESAAKPIIVLRHRGDVVPFDVKDVRYIEYDLDPRRIFDRYTLSKFEMPNGHCGPDRQNVRLRSRRP